MPHVSGNIKALYLLININVRIYIMDVDQQKSKCNPRTLSYSLSTSSYNFMLKSIYIITQRATQTETSFRKVYLHFILGLMYVHKCT